MLAVISPAKTFGQGKCAATEYTQPAFLKESHKLISYLKKMNANNLQKLMGVSQAIAKINVERYANWKKSLKSEQAECALSAFRGDVYRSLDSDSFDKRDFVFAQKHLLILSGLYGALKPLDLIRPYRLEMGTRLKTDKGDNLYQFWGDKVTRVLNGELQKDKSGVLINLASNEYFRVIDESKIKGKIITPVFKEKRGNTYKTIGIMAKRARGAMVRYIIKNRLRTVSAIKQFDCDGYRYRSDLSDLNQWVFARSA